MVELGLRVAGARVDALSEALLELGALSISTSDALADAEGEAALYGEPGEPLPLAAWERSELRALFSDTGAATSAATLLLAHPESAGVQLLGIEQVPDADWVRLTQAQFTPVEITPAFWIVPSWCQPPAGAERVLRLDPGLAFGTGTHATTRLCLRWIARHAPARAATWSRVLDYGCGSGILAITCALHGARGVEAIDVDTAAIEATRANAAHNGVAVAASTPDAAQGRYPLVLANILARPLELLAPLLAGHVAAGGDLVLSGILERQATQLTTAYAPWCALAVADAQEGWVLMSARPA